jgi:hypothetical protein
VLRLELMLFGIDLVMIEPGFVNTAMYDKGEEEDLGEFRQTEYWEAVQNFQKFIVIEGRKGLSPENGLTNNRTSRSRRFVRCSRGNLLDHCR